MGNKELEIIKEKIDALEKEFTKRIELLKKELMSALENNEEKGQESNKNITHGDEYVMTSNDNIYAYQVIPRGIIITGFNTRFQGGYIVIPSKIDNVPVIEVQAGAFKDNDAITGVRIARGITTIREKAFAYCNYIKTLEISDTVTVIENNAFAGCNSLKEITLPGSVKSVGEKAFYHCESLKSAYIPKSVESIGKNVFYMDNELMVYCEQESKPQAWDENWLGVGLTPEKKQKKVLWGM